MVVDAENERSGHRKGQQRASGPLVALPNQISRKKRRHNDYDRNEKILKCIQPNSQPRVRHPMNDVERQTNHYNPDHKSN
jgi:hypothetical protein